MITDMTDRGWVVTVQPTLDGAEYSVRAEMPMGIVVIGEPATHLSQAVYNTYDLTLSVENNL
jgi:hypothetical protein